MPDTLTRENLPISRIFKKKRFLELSDQEVIHFEKRDWDPYLPINSPDVWGDSSAIIYFFYMLGNKLRTLLKLNVKKISVIVNNYQLLKKMLIEILIST